MALIGTLKLSCQKATVLIERRDLKPLTPVERAGLWMHMRICYACKTYMQQSEAIDRLLEKRPQPAIDSSSFEDRIISGLY